MPVYNSYSADIIKADSNGVCGSCADCVKHPEIGHACHLTRVGMLDCVVAWEHVLVLERFCSKYLGNGDHHRAPIAVTWEDYISHNSLGETTTHRQRHIIAESYKGRVVEIFTRTERVMSDVYEDQTFAVVCDSQGRFIEVRAGYPENFCSSVDASDELMAVYIVWKQVRETLDRVTQIAGSRKRAKAEAIIEGKRPYKGRMVRIVKGRMVRIVKGRKVPVGTEGVVIWYGSGQYGDRIGIKVEGQEEPLWTLADNAEAFATPITEKKEAPKMHRSRRQRYGSRYNGY